MTKFILLIILLIMLAINATSQDSYPKPLKFDYKVGTIQKINSALDTNDLIQTSFHLGTQWYGHPRMMQALKMDVNHGTQEGSNIIANIDSNTYKMKYIWEYKTANYTRLFQYEPTLYIPYQDRGKFIIKANDKTHSIFGFSHILGTILPASDTSNENYDRLILYKDSSYVDSLVLKNSWINNKFEYWKDYPKDSTFNGKNWILSINLRRLHINEVSSNNIPLLTIKLAYKLISDTNKYYIKFKQVAPNDIGDSRLISYNTGEGIDTLGYYSNLRDNIGNPYEFKVYDNLLPDSNFYNSYGRKDITLNALFICSGFPNNPLLKDGVSGIDTLDIEVKYHGNKDIAINYLRLMTPQAESYIAGNAMETLRAKYQEVIDSAEAKGYEMYGISGRDEMTIEYFGFQRYLSQYFNFCLTSEGAGNDYFNHYNYHVQPHKVWMGALNFKDWVRAPYFFNHLNAMEYNNYRQYYRLQYPNLGYDDYGTGIIKRYNSELETDVRTWKPEKTNTLQSYWRTFRYNNIDTIYFHQNLTDPKSYGIEMYRLLLKFDNTLGMYEIGNYDMFYNNNDFLYSNKPWWGHNYVVGNWSVVSNGNYEHFAIINNCRPQTGEEVRLILWESLIFGAKGLTYDCWNDKLDTMNRNSNRTLGFLSSWDKNKFDSASFDEMRYSNDPTFGVDFIPAYDSSTMIHNFINFDSTATYLGVSKDRIYYGRKSPKLEMLDIHSWIRANNEKLMNLRLVSTFSKGFRIWRSADTARFQDTIMNHYIKLDNRLIIFDSDTTKTIATDYSIKTRRYDSIGNVLPFYEPYDSSFFDITLLRNNEDTLLNGNSIYIGVLNRRNDPMIKYDSIGYTQNIMRFLSTSELRDSCISDSTWWSKYWWRRLGTRELSIPFNLPNIAYGDGSYLEVKEIGLNKLDSLGLWFKSPYYQRIDTCLANNGILISKFLPGQGKIIEVQKKVIFDDTCNICNVVNNIDLINFKVHKIYSDSTNCCYDIILEKQQSCPFDSIPMRIILKGSDTNSIFNAQTMIDSSSGIRYTDFKINAPSQCTLSLGNLCIYLTKSITLEIVFGSDISNNFIGCNRKFSFSLDCNKLIDTAKNCCEKIDLTTEYLRDSLSATPCCTNIILKQTDSIHCVYGIDFNISNSDKINYIRKDSVPLVLGIKCDTLLKYCTPLAAAIPPAEEVSYYPIKIKFRGKDDEVICEKTVQIMSCCLVIDYPIDPTLPTQVPNNNSSKNTPEKNNEFRDYSFNILPNPNIGDIQLQINNLAKQIVNVNILNSESQTIKQISQVKLNSNYEEIDLDINDLPSGIYIVNISNDIINISKKIIKLK